MKIQEIGKKIADLLYENGYNGDISFVWNSYDEKEDIPHIFLDGCKRYDVGDFHISKDGLEVTITTIKEDGNYWDYTFYLNYVEDEDEGFADNEADYEVYLLNMGIYNLLQDVYYETNESYNIGDFEVNFLREEELTEA